MKRYTSILSLLAILAAWPALAADFNHADHLKTLGDGAGCSTCHAEGANTIRPDTKVCLDCHDQAFVAQVRLPGLKTHGPAWALQHRPAAKGGGAECAACHEQAFCLECHKSGNADQMGALGNNMSNVHRADFRITHPLAARTDQQLCSSCHERKFCSECHDDFRAGRAGSPSHRVLFRESAPFVADGFHDAVEITNLGDCSGCHTQAVLTPDTHTWARGHAREARRSLATCQACHPDGDVCITCHSVASGPARVNPHGSDWNDRKGNLKSASPKTCRRCHPEGTY